MHPGNIRTSRALEECVYQAQVVHSAEFQQKLTKSSSNEFANYLDKIKSSSESLFITGDFNIKVDVNDNSDALCVAQLLESMGL